MTGGWITQADRARWQQQAAAELAAILAGHPDIPVIAWTVSASGGALSGRVLAPRRGQARAVRGMAAGAGAGRCHRDPSGTGAAVYLHARGVRGGVAVSVTATVFDGEDSR